MSTKGKLYAVLTGDIVDSSKLPGPALEKCIKALRTAAAELDAIVPGTVAQQMAFFRGDAWQVLLGKPEQCVRAAVLLRCAVKMEAIAGKSDTRIGIGIGAVEIVSRRGASGSRGEAFTLSGGALDRLGKTRMAFAVSPRCGEAAASVAGSAVPLLDVIVSGWTRVEARAVYGALHGWTQTGIARTWPGPPGERPTQQAVQRALARAHWSAVASVLACIEQGIANVCQRVGTKTI